MLFLLTLKGKEDSWHGLWEAGDPGGEERESQEGERHSGHQRWPGQPLRSAHDWTAQEPPPDTAACWKRSFKGASCNNLLLFTCIQHIFKANTKVSQSPIYKLLFLLPL